MSSNIWTVIIVAALSSPSIVLLIGKLMPSRKDKADADFVNIQGEEKQSTLWKGLFDQQKINNEELRKEFDAKLLEVTRHRDLQIEDMKKEFASITASKDERINILEAKVKSLEGILKANNITF